MRMMRKGYNLSYEEVREAVLLAHERGKRAYITVNNLMNEEDLEEAKRYFAFLNEIGPDAIIAQDLAVFPDPGDELHEYSGSLLGHDERAQPGNDRSGQSIGRFRIVASREMDLKTAEVLQAKSGMEFEYFVHGDMCTVHGANCLYSSMLFGNSSNRGRCMKPCRWDYRVKKDGYLYPTEYPLAAKDMYMYESIPELIKSGITSFKIEGRMRDTEFLLMIVNSYGDAIDRYIADPLGYNREAGRTRCINIASAISRRLMPSASRDSTSLTAAMREQASFTVREGVQYAYRRTRDEGGTGAPGEGIASSCEAGTSGHVDSANYGACQHGRAGPCGIRRRSGRHLPDGDVFQPDRPFGREDIEALTADKGDAEIVLGMPRMMNELQMEQYHQFLSAGKEFNHYGLDGLLATNIGAMHKFQSLGLPLIADFSLNIYNHMAASFYQDHFGISRINPSLELQLHDLTKLLRHPEIPLRSSFTARQSSCIWSMIYTPTRQSSSP